MMVRKQIYGPCLAARNALRAATQRRTDGPALEAALRGADRARALLGFELYPETRDARAALTRVRRVGARLDSAQALFHFQNETLSRTSTATDWMY